MIIINEIDCYNLKNQHKKLADLWIISLIFHIIKLLNFFLTKALFDLNYFISPILNSIFLLVINELSSSYPN